MALPLVQQGAVAVGRATTTSAPAISGVTAGNFLLLWVALSDQTAANPTAAIATPSGWTAAENPTGPTGGVGFAPNVALFYKENATAGANSAAITFTTSVYSQAQICEFSGFPTSLSLMTGHTSVIVSTQTSTTGTVTATAATSQANSVVFAIISPDNATDNTASMSTPASAGYTSLFTIANDVTDLDRKSVV